MLSNTLDLEKNLETLLEKKGLEKTMAGKSVGLQRTEHGAISLPKSMSLDEGIQWLQRHKESQEQKVQTAVVINGFGADVAVGFQKVLKDLYGWVDVQPTPAFFGNVPPQMISVQVSPTESIKVPHGTFQVPGIDGTFAVSAYSISGTISANVKGKDVDKVNKIFELVKERVKTDSIYKGQAVETDFSSPTPKILDLAGIVATDLILPRDVEAAVKTTLLTPIAKAKLCRERGIPLKRGVLLSGTYGTGKSFTAMVTAQLAKTNGWTFIYLKDAENLVSALDLARNYAPSVLFVEDVDALIEDRDDDTNEILNVLDGVDGKDKEVVAVFTTNNVDKIHPAMLRPGRIDSIIEFKLPDADAAERLLQRYSRGLASENTDFSEVATIVAGMAPATIREVVERAKLAALGRDQEEISGKDLEQAALSMKNQVELLNRNVDEPDAFDIIADNSRIQTEALDKLTLLKEGHLLGKGVNCPRCGKIHD